MKEKKIGEATINTIALRNYLRDINDTDKIIPYLELSNLIKANVQADARGSLVSAVKMLLRDEGKVFKCFHGIGVKLLTDEEITEEMGGKVRRARNQSRKITELAENVSYDKLCPEKQVAYNARLTVARVMDLFSSKKSIHRITQGVMVSRKALPYADTLRLFNGAKSEE